MSLIDEISIVSADFRQELDQAEKIKQLEDIYRSYVGKNGKFNRLFQRLKDLPSDQEKRQVGTKIHTMINELKTIHEEKRIKIKEQIAQSKIEQSFFDLLRPVDLFKGEGSLHPITRAQQRVEEIFSAMGFEIADGPEVESDEMNFSRLNFSDDHPARDVHDTIWTKHQSLMRTHTSAVQTRIMERSKPPFRVISPGRCFRFEETDASHEHTFYQVEGMMIEEELSVVDLICVMQDFLNQFFGEKISVRLRPGYFPFVEPGFELDIACLICNGSGCSTCKKSGWLELLPCGLVHPNVLRSGKILTEKYSGLAFGLGLDRLVMMFHGIEDIRHFISGNVRFLEQFI